MRRAEVSHGLAWFIAIPISGRQEESAWVVLPIVSYERLGDACRRPLLAEMIPVVVPRPVCGVFRRVSPSISSHLLLSLQSKECIPSRRRRAGGPLCLSGKRPWGYRHEAAGAVTAVEALDAAPPYLSLALLSLPSSGARFKERAATHDRSIEPITAHHEAR